MTEKRKQSRYLCSDLVRVDWLVPKGETRTLEAVLEGISSAGACIQVEEPIPLDSTLSISLGPSRFTGHVCYCLHSDDAYFVGVEYSDGTTWSSDMVVPLHLTDLAVIARSARYGGLVQPTDSKTA